MVHSLTFLLISSQDTGHWFSSMGYHTVAATRIMKILSQESFSLIIPIATAGTFFVVK